MDAKQFAWMYLINEGRANVEPSYYGGYEAIDKNVPSVKKDYVNSFNDTFLKMIKNVGINWDKTRSPAANTFSLFSDTFHDPDEKEFLVGKLVLKDGYVQNWVGEPPVSSIFEMMANIDRYKADFKTLCGET